MCCENEKLLSGNRDEEGNLVYCFFKKYLWVVIMWGFVLGFGYLEMNRVLILFLGNVGIIAGRW